MSYYGISFLLPAGLSIAAFIAWCFVLSRMTNLKIHWYWRALALGWALLMLMAPIVDLQRTHTYDSTGAFYSVYVRMCMYRIGIFFIAILVYRLYGMAYPTRIALSDKEYCSALRSTEKFMAESNPDILIASDTDEGRLLEDKAKSRELAVVVKSAAVASEATKEAEQAMHKAGDAVERVDKAAKVAVVGSPGGGQSSSITHSG